MAELAGKVALITGASRGIGRGIAYRFAAEGAAVIVVASCLHQHGELDGTLQQTMTSIIEAGGQAVALVCDLTDVQARADLIARASELFGPIDILVNNAAGSKMLLASMVSTKQRNFMFDLNVNVPIELSQQSLTGMRQRGQGWILNISSRTVEQPEPPYPDSPMAAHAIGAYGATKAALNRYTEALAHELASENIFINALAPNNIVMTPGAAYVHAIAERRPDMVEPLEMMAEAALALCTGSHVGQVVYSRNIVHQTGRKVKSLDGKTIIGDAFMMAEKS